MSSAPTTAPVENKRIRTNLWIGLTLIIGLIALGLSSAVALYFYFHASAWQASFSASAQEQSDLKHTLRENKRSIASLNGSVTALTASDTNQAQSLAQLQTQVNTVQNALQTQLSTLPLAHSLYLVQLAQDALLYQFNSNKAVLYLQAAHNELMQSPDAELQALDSSLQQTLNSLKAMPSLNISKIVRQLSTLQDSINTLPLTQTEPKTNPRARDAHRSFWSNLWENAWGGLQKVITLKHYGAAAPHFITPDERAYLNARLCLYLSQAQWAALSHDTVLFNRSIQDAEQWLQTHYDTNNVIAQTLQKQLNELESIQLQPNFPELSPIINRLQHALISNEK